MGQPFPTNPEERRALAAKMKELEPELMEEINTLRKQIPTLRVTYFKSGSLEVGEPMSTDGWPVPDDYLKPKVDSVEDKEKVRKDERARQRRKARKT